jgi:toxin ParE1/3/4
VQVRRRLVFRATARTDLKNIYDYIEERSPRNAARYVDRIESYCVRLADFPERGTRRDDLSPGIRIIGIENRVGIAFFAFDDRVEIVRVLYGGRDIESAIEEGDF